MSESVTRPLKPSLILGLVNHSAGMARPRAPGRPSRLGAARLMLDRVVETLCQRYAAPDHPSIDVKVALIGYRTGSNGRGEFRPLLSGTRSEGQDWLGMSTILSPPAAGQTAWVSASRLGECPVGPRRPGRRRPRRWAEVADARRHRLADAAPADALLLAQRLVYLWLRFQSCAPPLVIHCGDDRPPDAETLRLTRSLSAMSTPWGPVGVIHCLFGDGLLPSDGSDPPDDRLRELWEASARLLPSPRRQPSCPEARTHRPALAPPVDRRVHARTAGRPGSLGDQTAGAEARPSGSRRNRPGSAASMC